jgi:phospholipid-translocating ATPase
VVGVAETAINIGFSCRLLTDEMEEPFIIDAESLEEVETQLRAALADVQKAAAPTKSDHYLPNGPNSAPSNTNSAAPPNVAFNGANATISTQANIDSDEFGEFALVINGHSLVSAVSLL